MFSTLRVVITLSSLLSFGAFAFFAPLLTPMIFLNCGKKIKKMPNKATRTATTQANAGLPFNGALSAATKKYPAKPPPNLLPWNKLTNVAFQ